MLWAINAMIWVYSCLLIFPILPGDEGVVIKRTKRWRWMFRPGYRSLPEGPQPSLLIGRTCVLLPITGLAIWLWYSWHFAGTWPEPHPWMLFAAWSLNYIQFTISYIARCRGWMAIVLVTFPHSGDVRPWSETAHLTQGTAVKRARKELSSPIAGLPWVKPNLSATVVRRSIMPKTGNVAFIDCGDKLVVAQNVK